MSLLVSLRELKVPQVRMFFKSEDRTNSFVMLRRKKHLHKQTYMRYGTGSIISRSLSMSKCGYIQRIAHFVSRSCKQRSVQIGSQATFLMLFALSYGMTNWINKI